MQNIHGKTFCEVTTCKTEAYMKEYLILKWIVKKHDLVILIELNQAAWR
jgi:hypothetical protein